MATVKTANYPAQTWSLSTLKIFFDNLNCSIITTDLSSNVLTIHVNGVVDFLFDFNTGTTRVVYNGVSTGYSYLNTWNSATITAVYSNVVFYVQFTCNYGSGRRVLFLYESINGVDYFGAVGAGTESTAGHAWYPITSVTLLNTSTGVTFSHDVILNYSVEQGYIHYASDYLFSEGYKTSAVDANFITCSSVPTNRIITFKSHNYYSVGANTLIQVD